MLTKIELKAFKCFKHLQLPLRAMTVLSGINASGKSSVLQALLLLHQTVRINEYSRCLLLNGPAVSLGTVADVMNREHGRDGIEIRLATDGKESTKFGWTFTGSNESMAMEIAKLWPEGDMHVQRGDYPYKRLLPAGGAWQENRPRAAGYMQCLADNLAYLSAERAGPRDTYPLGEFSRGFCISPSGDNTAGFLHKRGDLPEENGAPLILPDLQIEGVVPTISQHVHEWMGRFFPGFAMQINKVDLTNSVTIGIQISGEVMRPSNTGFGITQVLPIVVAALASQKSSFLLVENPEVHLHPAGQALMGEFLSTVARAGVQVIIETHSDHVLNGIRRAVKGGKLPAADVALHFFRPVVDDGAAQVERPIMDDQGKLDYWPDGFFDQIDKDTAHFAGWD